jgi:hypothetical protein
VATGRLGAPERLVLVGSSVFIFVLWFAAYLEPDIRWLHFFQAWMYVAASWLSLRRSRWGYFIGISAAAYWDYVTVFVNTFLRSGVHWLAVSVAARQLTRVDQIIAVPAWIANSLVVAGSIWAYARLRETRSGDLARLVVAFTLTTGFFAAAIWICQPRYLPMFRASLHPHRPW